MKTTSNIAPLSMIKAVTAVACLSFTLLQNLPGQSADVLQSLSNNNQAAGGEGSTQPAPDVDQLITKPSRFSISHVEQYTDARIAGFYMNDKKMDAFGLYQDPTFRPVIKNTPTAIKRGPSHIAAKPLSEIVQGIKVSTIMVREKKFLVGVRSFKEAEEFSISYDEGRTKRLKVIKVDPSEITFKDLDSNEEAKLKIDVLPPGMSAGDDSIKPAGMVSPAGDQPLILETK